MAHPIFRCMWTGTGACPYVLMGTGRDNGPLTAWVDGLLASRLSPFRLSPFAFSPLASRLSPFRLSPFAFRLSPLTSPVSRLPSYRLYYAQPWTP